ncbi:uncharacterized protein LOC131946060 [Physella acuta]|uniref:uncharacterized protein LOC131946060 n=1 Tax=Physella acuta TaxID=109671 RepID=UPI0027DC44BB|nr:uncharacterized protein LOC131946060 [Physella acuta]
MRPEIQVNLITEQRKHLEEYLQVLGPVVESMKHALEKSKSWIEDRNDNPSITHMELCQELESVTTALLGAASHIIGRNKNNCCDNKATAFPTAPQTTATEKADGDLGLLAHHVTKQQTAQILTRIEMIETALSLLQDTKQKTEDDISEIKQWRENFLSEQNDTAEKFFRQQTENIGSLREQMSEQDNKVKELNKEFESLKENESKSNKTLEKLSLDMKEYENNLKKINTEIYTDKTDNIAKEIEHTVNDVLSFSTAFQTMGSRDCKRYACFSRITRNPPVRIGSIISRFDDVREYNGQHINSTTGKFVSPHDGLYLVCITLHEWSDRMIRVGVFLEDKLRQIVKVGSASTKASGSVVIDMKKGEELYLQVTQTEEDAWLSLNSSFTIVML